MRPKITPAIDSNCYAVLSESVHHHHNLRTRPNLKRDRANSRSQTYY